MHFKHFIAILLSALFLVSGGAHAMQAVGKVTLIKNTVTITSHDKTDAEGLKEGQAIHLGDKIVTENETSFVRVDFVDGTHITMNGEDGELTIDEYIFDPANLDMNKAKFSILKGSFEFVGGLLDKGPEENVELQLDFGSIGIRGTKILRTMKDNECWIFLEEGEIRVFNDGGAVTLKPGDGTRMSDTAKAPTEAKPWSQANIDWIKGETAVPE